MQVKALDVSTYQGLIDWKKVKAAGYQIAIIKMAGGDSGLYLDPKASTNYYGAKNNGLTVGGYYFGGGKNKPEVEADYFIKAMSPLAKYDVFVLDCEATLAAKPDVVSWCYNFMAHVHNKIGVWPLIYMNLSTLNAHDWSIVLKNCGLWLAAWNNNPNATLTKHPYVMHQYADNGKVPGISGNVDLDMFFGTVDQFKKYGYQAPKVVQDVKPPAPIPKPAPAPAPAPPQSQTPTQSSPQPLPDTGSGQAATETQPPAVETPPEVDPVVFETKPVKPMLIRIIDFIRNVLNKLRRKG